MNADDELMTRRQARQRDAEDECRRDGHDLEVSQVRSFGGNAEPVGITCGRCRERWSVGAPGLPYIVMLNGVEVARIVCTDDGLDPQHEGIVHDLAVAVSNYTDGLVTVIDERLSMQHAMVAAFEDGKEST